MSLPQCVVAHDADAVFDDIRGMGGFDPTFIFVNVAWSRRVAGSSLSLRASHYR